MTSELPFVSIVIAARPDQADVQSLVAARALDYPADRLEIIVARGRQPSVQRNTAVRETRGELIYFLDDDSRPGPQALRRGAAHFADPKVVMVGGPNLCPPDAPAVEQAFALAMGSTLAFGPSAARYRVMGEVRPTSEKELILCNMLVRRKDFLELGGFDEQLYPNEENALMDEIQERGGVLLHDPEMTVWRRPRGTWRAFMRMLRTYGRGRAEQFRRHPSTGSILNFVPPMLVVYLILWSWLPALLRWPLALYGLVIVLESIRLARLRPAALWRLPILLILCHVCYGMGFWLGLCTRFSKGTGRPPIEVKLEKAAP